MSCHQQDTVLQHACAEWAGLGQGMLTHMVTTPHLPGVQPVLQDAAAQEALHVAPQVAGQQHVVRLQRHLLLALAAAQRAQHGLRVELGRTLGGPLLLAALLLLLLLLLLLQARDLVWVLVCHQLRGRHGQL
jgi:hypothetical protein